MIPAQLAPDDIPVAIGPQLRRVLSSLPFSAQIGRVSVFGNRFGTPYAQADVHVAALTFPGQDLALRGLNVSCTWDTAGARAHVTMQNAGDEPTVVAPNTRVELPGLGYLILNEQFIHITDVYDATGAPRQMQVINVVGAHLYLASQAATTYGVGDVRFGWAACGPLSLPALSGLRFESGAVAGASGGLPV